MATAASIALGAVWSSVAMGARGAAARSPMSGRGAVDGGAVLADHLLKAFPEPHSLRVIGDAYRRGHADNAAALTPEVFQDVLRHLDLSEADLAEMTPGDLRSRIDARTAKDFSEGRIIGVEGWLLGETEARLCEVAALRAG